MSTQVTIDPGATIPDAYHAEFRKSLARRRFDWIPEEQERSLDYQIEGSECCASTSAWAFRAPLLFSDLTLQEAFMLPRSGFRAVFMTALNAQLDGLTTSDVIDPQEMDRRERVDWDRWHELLDKAETGDLLPGEAIEYERIGELVQALDEREARVAVQGLDQLERRHDRVLASIRRLTDAVTAATKRS